MSRRRFVGRSSSSLPSVIRRASTSSLEHLEFRLLLAAADPDSTFGTSGVAQQNLGAFDVVANAVDASGNIAVVGDGSTDAVLAQFSASGGLNWSVPLGLYFNDAIDVAIDSAGRIIVAGTNSLQMFTVARFNSLVGTLDTSFAGDGVFGDDLLTESNPNATATAVAVGLNDTVLVVGNDSASANMAAFQLDSSGARDEFVGGDGGYVVIDLQTNASEAWGVAFQSNGTTAVISGFSSGTTQDYAIVLLEPNGSMTQTITDNLGSERLFAVTVGTSNAIHAVGLDNSNAAVLLTYDALGTLTATTNIGSFAGGVDADSAGNVYVATNPDGLSLALTRFTPAGAIDSAFGTGGTVSLATGGTSVLTFDVAVQSGNNKPVAAGFSDANVALARWGDNGGGGDQVVVAMNGNDLTVTGTTGADAVVVTRNTSGVFVQAGLMTYGPFSPSGQIRITLGDGNDQLNVASSMTVSMFVDGGAGDDTIKGGGGNDILLGGPGNDRLMGAAGRDLLIGGTGADRILGDQDDDIMISGTTAHDTNAAALQAIASEWTSTRSYLVRIANIQDGSGSPTMRNNGSFFFAVGSTLSDDGAADSLTGNAGSDWFILSATDVLTNVQSSEFGPTIV
jgi:hypothetical protein